MDVYSIASAFRKTIWHDFIRSNSAHIICFEPDAKSFDLLQKNISSHHLKNIDARNEAIWFENTSLNFIQEGNMASRIGIDSPVNTVSVKAVRLKDYLNQKVDFLKIDI